jgi:hypothetical protein
MLHGALQFTLLFWYDTNWQLLTYSSKRLFSDSRQCSHSPQETIPHIVVAMFFSTVKKSKEGTISHDCREMEYKGI